jgi:hypothetical protein
MEIVSEKCKECDVMWALIVLIGEDKEEVLAL